MTYRDDRDADQARIAALELELARARDRIAELEGKETALVRVSSRELVAGGPPTPAVRWLGARLKLELTRRFDRAISAEHFDDLVERIRSLTGDPGRTDLLRSSLTWRSTAPHGGTGPFLTVTVTARDNATVLTVGDRLGQLAGALYGGVGGGVGGGGITAPILASIAMPVLAPFLIAGWLGGVYFGV